jgi:hypothetical protein
VGIADSLEVEVSSMVPESELFAHPTVASESEGRGQEEADGIVTDPEVVISFVVMALLDLSTASEILGVWVDNTVLKL